MWNLVQKKLWSGSEAEHTLAETLWADKKFQKDLRLIKSSEITHTLKHTHAHTQAKTF